MALYGGPTPKRHVAFSNSATVAKLNLGKLEGWQKKVKQDEAAGIQRVKTVRKYIDKNGKPRYHGSEGLKASEPETKLSAITIANLRQYIMNTCV